jgi:hypothetical protein
MSLIAETPMVTNTEGLTTSFYIPIEDDESTVFSNHAAHANEMITFSKKKFSDGYRFLLKPNKNRKPVLFEYFSTKNIIGYPIRNACTGYLYPQYRVGHYHEYLFFKIRVSTKDSYQAQNNNIQNKFAPAATKLKPYDKPELEVLFYDSPEEYESHQQLTLPHDMKLKWRARYEKLIRFMEKNNYSHIENQNQDYHILSSNKSNINNEPLGLTILNRSMTPDTPPPGYVESIIV